VLGIRSCPDGYNDSSGRFQPAVNNRGQLGFGDIFAIWDAKMVTKPGQIRLFGMLLPGSVKSSAVEEGSISPERTIKTSDQGSPNGSFNISYMLVPDFFDFTVNNYTRKESVYE